MSAAYSPYKPGLFAGGSGSDAESAHKGAIYGIRYNAQGEYVLTAGQDKTVKLWSSARRALLKTYRGHGYEVFGVAVSHDNALFASGGGDRQVYLWDVATGVSNRKFEGHLQRVNCVEFNDDMCSVLASGSYDTTVRLWDLRAKSAPRPIQTLTSCRDSVTGIIIRKHEIIVSSVDGCVRIFDLRMGNVAVDDFGFPATSVSLSKDAQCLLVSTLNSTLRVVDKPTGELLSSYTGHRNADYGLRSCFSHDDALVCSGSEDGNLHVWDLVEGAELQRSKMHQGALLSVAHHPETPAMLTGGSDGRLVLWQQEPPLI